ncbi:MAG TPA: hypothetical protein VGH97_13670 [Thermoanaerobaculia bacterium]|jgi:hypothetical protein
MLRIARASMVLGFVLGFGALPGRLYADTRVEKTLRLEPGGEFRLDTDMGKVTVTGTSESGARVVITSKHKDLDELMSFRFEEHAGSVSIVARKKHRFSFFGNSGDNVQYEIQVPASTRLSIETSGGGITISGMRDTVKLNTSGGGIRVRDQVGDLDADTSGGGIRLTDVKGKVRANTSGGGVVAEGIDGSIRAESSGGSIELARVSGDIDAETSGGGIRIEQAGGRVHADTSGGGIEATFAKGNSMGGTLETSGGGIEVGLDPEADLSIEASGNGVRSDLPLRVQGEISRGRLSGNLGKGGNTLRLHTSGGSVRIQSL